jgi:hypothetical protein
MGFVPFLSVCCSESWEADDRGHVTRRANHFIISSAEKADTHSRYLLGGNRKYTDDSPVLAVSIKSDFGKRLPEGWEEVGTSCSVGLQTPNPID